MPLCMSLQYPLQNRAKIQKKIEICKKNNKIPDFSRVVLVYCTSYQQRQFCGKCLSQCVALSCAQACLLLC